MIETNLPAPGTICLSTDGLPEGWLLARVGDMVDLVNGFAFKPSHWKGRGLPIIRIQNLNNPDAPFNYCPDSMPDKYLVETDDLLFAWSGTPGTSFGAHVWKGARGLLNQHIFRVDFDENLLDKRFVRLAINHNLDDYIAQAHGGVGLAHITKSNFETSLLSLPPLAEQKRIVRKVEKCLAHVNSARHNLSHVPAILKRFRQVVLAAACSGRLTEDWRNDPDGHEDGSLPRTWTTMPLEKLIHHLEQGWSPQCDNEPSQSSDVWAVIKTTAVQSLSFLQFENKVLPATLSARPELEIKVGDLLITRAGPRSRVGISCLVRFVRPRLILCDKVYRFRADESYILPSYLEYALNAPSMTAILDFLKTGTSDSGVNLTQAKFLELIINIPSLDEQAEIVRRIETLFAFADTIEQRIATAKSRVESLLQSILAKAFRGELVPTEAELARREGREYEPASVLLERIKKQREQEISNQPKRKRTRPKTKLAAARG
jgi:type I restriction enzyme S subunit